MTRIALIRIIVMMLISASAVAQQVEESVVPLNVRTAVKEKSGGNDVSFWVKDPARKKYVASVLKENTLKVIEVGFDGQWIATTEGLQERQVPAPVMSTIRAKYLSKGFEGDNYVLVRDRKEGTYYAADLTSDDEDLHIRLDAKGTVLAVKNR